jgi:hypothetical protein
MYFMIEVLDLTLLLLNFIAALHESGLEHGELFVD